MKEFVGILRMDCWRAFTSVGFLLAVFGMLLALLFNTSTERAVMDSGEADVLYLYVVAHFQSFLVLYVILAALPYATSFCTDWNYQFIRFAVIRSNIKKYGISRVIICALSGGAAVALGELLFILFFRLNLPLVNTQNPVFESICSTFYGDLLVSGHFIAYFASRIIVISSAAAVFAVLALLISTYITNVFVTLGFPLVAFYSLINLSGQIGLPKWLNLYSILFGTCLETPTASVIYSFFSCSLLCVLLGVLAVRKIERRLEHG